jgi:hypothetical protein
MKFGGGGQEARDEAGGVQRKGKPGSIKASLYLAQSCVVGNKSMKKFFLFCLWMFATEQEHAAASQRNWGNTQGSGLFPLDVKAESLATVGLRLCVQVQTRG